MRKTILAVLAAAAAMQAAHAADMPAPVLKAPPPPPAPLWSGLYVGVQGGYGWGQARQTEITFDTFDYDVKGGIVGVTWGYNYQAGNLVIGFEGDASYAKIDGSTDGATATLGPCGGAPPQCSAELRWLVTSRARVGVAWGGFMPYVTGGLAWGQIHGEEGTLPIVVAQGSGSKSRYGWTAGGGVEAKLWGNWSAKVEYLYVDLGGGRVFIDTFPGGFSSGEDVNFHTHIVRAGLNYSFGPGFSVLPMLATSAGPYNWTGFYIGGTSGGGFGHARQTDAAGFDSGKYGVSGVVAGGTIGYNWQASSIVMGLEADASYASIKGETDGSPVPCFGNPETCGAELHWFGTARARLGVAWDRFLPYVTGGVAWGSLEGHEGDLVANGGAGSDTKTRWGWTAGGGVEVKINSNWSSKFEYLYVDLRNKHQFDDVLLGGGTIAENVSFRSHVIRAGLNYSFNWGQPVVARY